MCTRAGVHKRQQNNAVQVTRVRRDDNERSRPQRLVNSPSHFANSSRNVLHVGHALNDVGRIEEGAINGQDGGRKPITRLSK